MKGKVSKFRILEFGKGAELGVAIGIELHGTVFCPVHDFRGNVVAIVDPVTSKVSKAIATRHLVIERSMMAKREKNNSLNLVLFRRLMLFFICVIFFL